MATYSAGDHAFRRLAEQIKDALDPNGSLSLCPPVDQYLLSSFFLQASWHPAVLEFGRRATVGRDGRSTGKVR
jgi:hypothetical protein